MGMANIWLAFPRHPLPLSQVRSKLLWLNIQFNCQTLFIVYHDGGPDRDEEQ